MGTSSDEVPLGEHHALDQDSELVLPLPQELQIRWCVIEVIEHIAREHGDGRELRAGTLEPRDLVRAPGETAEARVWVALRQDVRHRTEQGLVHGQEDVNLQGARL